MTAQETTALCGHCGLPVGRRGTRQTIDQEEHAFCCYGCSLAFQVRRGNHAEADSTWLLIRLGVGAFLAMNIKLFSLLIYTGTFEEADAHLLPFVHVLLWALATPMLVILGWPFARDAWQEGRRGQLTSNTLMTLGVAAAYVYSSLAVVQGGGQVYFDTVALLLVLFTLGRLLEANARARAVRDLAPMLEAERLWATRLRPDGTEERVRVRDVLPGMRLRVRPGERIPVDGVVLEGCSHADESILTGEPTPVSKKPGSAGLSGSINQEGHLTLEATVSGTASHWARICRTVRLALAQRSPTQRLTDRVAGIFVPIVLVLAAVAVFYWMAHVPFETALFTGLAVLVVACPCALGLAAPLATTLGIGRLIQYGVLVRGAEVMERLPRIKVVAFDKTGTLTVGKVRLRSIESDGIGADELLCRIAGLEQGSEHPLARATLQAARERSLAPVAVSDIRAIPGRGVIGQCGDEVIAAGTGALAKDLEWQIPPTLVTRLSRLEASGQTIVHVGWNGRLRGILAFEDEVLGEAAETVRQLQRQGLHCVLLTGDLPAAAARVADSVGIDSWNARLSPDQKREAVERLTSQWGPVLMVGDGLNDGPVLASASVGVAVGSATDLARETADITLPRHGLQLLPWTLTWGKRVRRTVGTNLMWAFGYNGIALVMAAVGYLSPIWAAAIMAGSSLLVIGNSMRLESFSPGVPSTCAQPKDEDAEPSGAGGTRYPLAGRRTPSADAVAPVAAGGRGSR